MFSQLLFSNTLLLLCLKDDFNGLSDYVKDVTKKFNICMRSSVRKSTTYRDGNLLGEWSIILSLKLVSMNQSCPRMPDRCDVITPPIERVRHACMVGVRATRHALG